ncbi:hypothetical protein Tsubulata_041233 [Turnera subulata]|uniref:Uncharacterized protein n=1 Tax=Turnera subulata TaxID=218843 RepID=A0A9Q0FHC7_9ROSI|nr:hypothetical protein Tsubulata_041233 [Turnera subulata]
MQNIRKSPRVADENMFNNGGGEYPINFADRHRAGRWNNNGAFSAILSVLLVPFSILSCFSQPHVNGADGLWVSGEFVQLSEMNHLMVNDSMRYAILM